MTEQQVALNGSRPLVVANLMDSQYKSSAKAEARRAALSANSTVASVTSVARVTRQTFSAKMVVRGSYQYTVDGVKTTKLTGLLMDPTSEYNGTEEIFQEKKLASGKTQPPAALINKLTSTLSIAVDTGKDGQARLEKWRSRGFALPDFAQYYDFKGPCVVDFKVDVEGVVPTVELHESYIVSISVFGYLPPTDPDPKKPNQKLRDPEGVGYSISVHTLKRIGEANSPLLTGVLLENPQFVGMPIKTLAEVKAVDTTRNIGKDGKTDIVGSVVVTVPYLCGIQALEEPFLLLENGSLATLELQSKAGANPLECQKKGNAVARIADLVFTIKQWRGDHFSCNVATTRLWDEATAIFGVAHHANWVNGLGEAFLKQTPAFYSGVISHTDSDQMTAANTNEEITSFLSIRAKQPIADVPGSVSGIFGVPVSLHYVKHVSLPMKRANSSVPVTHLSFTFADETLFDSNAVNTSSSEVLFVLNELEVVKRKAIFDDKEAGFLYFAVVGGKLMTEVDHELLQKLRVLQQTPDYAGPLGEMLLWANFNPSDPNKWKNYIYGPTASEPACIIPPSHPVIVDRKGALAQKEQAVVYLYAFSTVRYAKAMEKKNAVVPGVGAKRDHLAIENTATQVNDGAPSSDNDDDDDDDDERENKNARRFE